MEVRDHATPRIIRQIKTLYNDVISKSLDQSVLLKYKGQFK